MNAFDESSEESNGSNHEDGDIAGLDVGAFAFPNGGDAPAAPISAPPNPVVAFVDRIVQGRALGGVQNTQAKRLEAHYAALLRPSSAPMPAVASAGIYVDTDALERHAARLARQIEHLEAECARAHDWRFHLESHMRDVRAGLLYFRDDVKRSPTLEEYSGLLDALRAGISWTPTT